MKPISILVSTFHIVKTFSGFKGTQQTFTSLNLTVGASEKCLKYVKILQ